MTGRRGFVVAAFVAVIVISVYLVNSAAQSVLYYQYPGEALAHLDRFPDGTRFMLAGLVAPGTLVESGNVSTFEVTDFEASIPVRLVDTPPPLFAEDVSVLLSGSFDQGVFVADGAVIRHDESYQVPSTGDG